VELRIQPLEDARFPGDTSFFSPLQPVRALVTGARRALTVAVAISDGVGQVYAARNVPLDGGEGSFDFRVVGALGTHTVKAMPDGIGEIMTAARFTVRAEAGAHTGDGALDTFLPRLKAFMLNNVTAFYAGRDVVNGYGGAERPTIGIRDHTLQMKGFRHWERDMKSAVEHFCRRQMRNGSFFDSVARGRVGPEHDRPQDPTYCDQTHDLSYRRCGAAADVEYLVVEAVYRAWQATGDDEWMRSLLPVLEKGLDYSMSDPQRWSAEHGLVQREFAPDTWGIEPGDNTGMYQSSRMLAALFARVRLDRKAAEWTENAERFRERVNEVCWNGRFYRHRVDIAPGGAERADPAEHLSLSNAYALNRGTLTHEMAASIIREYQRRRELRRDTHFAEWFSTDPPLAGLARHADAGIMPLVGGELARGAFEHGFEDYGADILRRYQAMIEQASATYPWYRPDGTPPEGGVSPHDGCGAAAMLCAFMEGLCGVVDGSKLYERVRLSPRWPAAGIARALVLARYGASDAYIAYDYAQGEDGIAIELSGSGREIALHVLLPEGFWVGAVRADGQEVPFEVAEVEASRYVDLEVRSSTRRVEVRPPTPGPEG
jgi:hypothetical protein